MAQFMSLPTDDADQLYPETSGYAGFVEMHTHALETLAALRNNEDTKKHMLEHLDLLLESGHTGVRRIPHSCASPCRRKQLHSFLTMCRAALVHGAAF